MVLSSSKEEKQEGQEALLKLQRLCLCCYTILFPPHNQEEPMPYWTRTDDHLRTNEAPKCPWCGKPMVPIDDHGRFGCVLCPKAPRGEHGFPVTDVSAEDDY